MIVIGGHQTKPGPVYKRRSMVQNGVQIRGVYDF